MRRETGNEQSVQVRYDEGVAIHIDPEPCAVACKGGSEASAEEHIGQPLSPAKIHIPGADAVAKAEGDTDGPAKLILPVDTRRPLGCDYCKSPNYSSSEASSFQFKVLPRAGDAERL